MRRTQPFEETFERWEGPLALTAIVSQLGKMVELWEPGVQFVTSAVERFADGGNAESACGGQSCD